VFLLRKIWKRLDADGCADLAAQVSFYFVLSLFPFLLVLASLPGWIPTTDRWEAFAIYRALGGFIVLMLWIYAVNLIVLIGAETDTALRKLRDGAGA
jgi:uncharacterized BrkB/YihY/UPF0761 family membrane protein